MSKWEKVRLGDVCDVRDGTHESPKYVLQGYPLVTSKNLTNGHIDVSSANYISKDDFLKINCRSCVDDGDILMPMIGTIGNPIIVAKIFDFAIKNVALIKFNEVNNVSNKYILYLLSSNLFQNYIEKENRGGTQKFLSLNIIRDFPFFLPPLAEQKRIADVLDKASGLIKKRKEQIRLIDQLAKSLFVEMFGDPVENPMGWEMKVFSEVADITTRMITDFSSYGDLPHIGIENIEKESGKLVNYQSVKDSLIISGKYYFDERHIIYSKIRPNLNKVATPDFTGLCSADAYPILPNENVVTKYYLVYMLRSPYFLDYILKHSDRTNIPKANKEQLRGFKMPIPPLCLQKKFAYRIDAIEKQKALFETGLEKLEMNYRALMQEYFG